MERMRGVDAVFLHLEGPDTPLHTMKVVVLETSRQGRPVDLAEFEAAVRPRLGLVPRSTQRVARVPGLARPFWVADPTFDLSSTSTSGCFAPQESGGNSTTCSRSSRPHTSIEAGHCGP